ncbi:hypothetical protein PV327_007781 [Microctonus hyperodae]|uniref:NADH dehydrogenase [ubiquinone] 1 beta subcomplex subunit 11, mitochondrial n=1 Tax=Microctonus hyperodae TaxID=165561 RepID=A0AA39KYZ0_MICHY|nr:hypothetical protein PV327_007781 [Microctonus hyperodae]
MASFIRFGFIRAVNNNLIKSISTKSPKLPLSSSLVRCVNTSSKPPQANTGTSTSSIVNPITTDTHALEETNKSEDWISYGMSEEDKWWDRFSMHSTIFMGYSVCIIFGGTLLAYMPDMRDHEWTAREAYLQLRYREENGLPLVDPNLIDPAKIILPTDEELGDTEVII